MTTERARPFAAAQTSSKRNSEGVFCCSPIPRDNEMTIRQVVVPAARARPRTESPGIIYGITSHTLPPTFVQFSSMPSIHPPFFWLLPYYRQSGNLREWMPQKSYGHPEGLEQISCPSESLISFSYTIVYPKSRELYIALPLPTVTSRAKGYCTTGSLESTFSGVRIL